MSILLIHVGGQLRSSEDLDTILPIVLDPNHQNTRLLIKDFDSQLGLLDLKVFPVLY